MLANQNAINLLPDTSKKRAIYGTLMAARLPDSALAGKWLENRFSQKSSELESFQTPGLTIPFGSIKSSSVVNSMKKIDFVDFRMGSHDQRSGALEPRTAFFGSGPA